MIGYRSNHAMNINPETQSIRSTESHLSQQEIMPSEIRKRLTEVKTTGPITFDVKKYNIKHYFVLNKKFLFYFYSVILKTHRQLH